MSEKSRIKKIAFIYYKMSSFIQKDLNHLRKKYEVIPVQYEGFKSIPKVIKTIYNSDLSFSWFAGGHAALSILISKIFRKPSIVILGGYEVAKNPEINYGAALNKFSAFKSKIALKYATKVLSVDKSLVKESIKNYGIDKGEVLPTGYDSNYYTSGIKENIVLTVSPSESYVRKGIPLFIKAAESFPKLRFIIVGGDPISAPKNVTFTGRISDELLLDMYRRSKVYCQLSYHEGLPNALCEAMLCECVPVGTQVNGIPKVIGDTGFLINNLEDLVETIPRAFMKDGSFARSRIIKKFPEEQRREGLWNVVDSIIS